MNIPLTNLIVQLLALQGNKTAFRILPMRVFVELPEIVFRRSTTFLLKQTENRSGVLITSPILKSVTFVNSRRLIDWYLQMNLGGSGICS